MSRLQLNFNGGEIDPDEYERVDLALYDNGLARGLNVISRPHGGLSVRPGMSVFARLKRKLFQWDVTENELTLPNGGVAADFVNGAAFATVTGSVADTDYSIAEIDFGVAVSVAAVDITDYYLDDGSAGAGTTPPGGGGTGGGSTPDDPLPDGRDDGGDEFYGYDDYNYDFRKPSAKISASDPSVAVLDYPNLRVQYSVSGVWYDFGMPQDIDTGLRTRRFSQSPPRAAQNWRIMADGIAAAQTFHADNLSFHIETSELSGAAQIPFAFSSDQYYSVWLSDQNAEIFSNGVYLASVAIPHISEDLARVTYVQALDTLILFHPDYAPFRILRSGRHTAWDSRAVAYENIPLFDYTGEALNGEDAQQQLRFTDYLSGDVFNITIAGETTRSITYGASTAALVQSALLELKNLRNGGVSVSASGDILTIDFTGNNGNREWPEMFGTTVSSESGGVVASTVNRGKAGGEAVISAARGWPRCGSFYQQRQFLGGLKSRPATLLGTVSGDYFNLNTDLESVDVGLDFTLDGSGVVEVRHIVAGRNLMVFTASAEYFVPSDSVSRDEFTIRQASAVGCRETIRPVVVDGPILFIGRRSGALYASVFNEAEQNYVPENISMHASHLLPNPIALTRRPARRTKEADLIVMPNRGDNPAALLTLLRSHDVVAFTRMETAGEIISVGVEDEANLEFAVQRNGDIYLEVFDDGAVLDSSVFDVSDGTPIASVDMSHLADGTQVCVVRNGAFIENVTIANGLAVFTTPLEGAIEVGLRFDVEFDTLPVRKTSEQGGFRKEKYRIVKAHFWFETCPAFEVSANGGKFYRYEPQKPGGFNFDEALPVHKGEVIAAGFTGSTVRPDLKFRLAVPGAFHLKSLDMETSQ